MTKLIEWYRFGVGDEKSMFVTFLSLSSERVNFVICVIVVGKNYWSACESLEENSARARSAPPELAKRAPKVGGFAAHFACGFFEFWGGTRSRIVLLEVFAGRLSILSDDDCSASMFRLTLVSDDKKPPSHS